MVTIAIQTEEPILKALQEIAQEKQTSLEAITQEALQQYLQRQRPSSNKYSFIGIGHSGKGNISSQVETSLTQAASRRTGWSLPESRPYLIPAFCWPSWTLMMNFIKPVRLLY